MPPLSSHSFFQLLRQSWTYYKSHGREILLAAAVAALLASFIQGITGQKISVIVPDFAKDLETQFPGVGEIDYNDPASFPEYLNAINEHVETLQMNDDKESEAQIEAYRRGFFSVLFVIGPMLLLVFFAVSIIVTTLNLYYFLLALLPPQSNGTQRMHQALSAIPKNILPFIGLMIWMFLRSFAWVPFIGPIIALFIGPRMIAAPVIFFTQKKGILESVRKSFAVTQNAWLYVFLYILGMAIAIGLVAFGVSLILAIIDAISVSYYVSLFLDTLLQYLSLAYVVIFTVYLSQMLLQHPKKS